MTPTPAAFDTAFSAYQRSASPTIPKGASATEARKAAEEFTSFFMSQMLEIMFQGISTDGPFGGGPAEGIYRSMMLQEYGKTLALEKLLALGEREAKGKSIGPVEGDRRGPRPPMRDAPASKEGPGARA